MNVLFKRKIVYYNDYNDSIIHPTVALIQGPYLWCLHTLRENIWFHRCTRSSDYHLHSRRVFVCRGFSFRSDTQPITKQPEKQEGSKLVYSWQDNWHNCQMDSENLKSDYYCWPQRSVQWSSERDFWRNLLAPVKMINTDYNPSTVIIFEYFS